MCSMFTQRHQPPFEFSAWSTKDQGEINPNFNNYHTDPMEISSTFSIQDITDWRCQQAVTHSQYTDLSNVATDMFSILPHGVGVQSSFSLTRDVLGWRQSKTCDETLCEIFVVLLFVGANKGILTGDNLALDTKNTENDSKMKEEVVESQCHRMMKVYDLLEIWQSSQILHATQKEACPQNKQLTAVWYISVIDEIVKVSWSLFEHDGFAAFK